MYDCLELPTVTSPTRPPVRFNLSLHWRNRNRLLLRCAPQIAPHRLQLAFAAASSFSLPSKNLPDGSLVIFDLSLEEALLFQKRFTDLLAHFEPAVGSGLTHT